MKVTVITVCRNAGREVEETIRSVMIQDHQDIEYIVVDGASTDDTLERIGRYEEVISRIISEPDEGVYDAMNKGLRLATGEVVAFVNAGDMIATRNTISYMARAFAEGNEDVIYGDIVMVAPNDIRQVKRFWKGGEYDRGNFRKGWMPPHPGTYIRRSAYEQFGLFNTDLRIGADYELMFRFMYRHRLPARYVPKVLVRFRLGGMSNRSVKHIVQANWEVYRSWRLNGEKASPFLVPRKLMRKVVQMLQRTPG